VVNGYRGSARGDALVKMIVTLPAELLTELDVLVTYRKQADRSFNRSALIQEALTRFVEVLNER
jgi:metal-responsive CopG/Arc/MetJ family transcriptional regulator